jgi:subtilisin-like proprotein convertase family protein
MYLLNLISVLTVSALFAAYSTRELILTFNGAPVPIPDNTGSLSVCQTIDVSEQCNVNEVSVRVTSEHIWIGDITFAVTAPSGTGLTLLNRPGRFQVGSGEDDNLVSTVPIQFSDFAVSGISAEDMGAGCANGDIGITPGCADDNYLPAPDPGDTPIPGLGMAFSDFFEEEAQGTWFLCAGDSAPGNTGTLISWEIELNCFVPVELESFSAEPE